MILEWNESYGYFQKHSFYAHGAAEALKNAELRTPRRAGSIKITNATQHGSVKVEIYDTSSAGTPRWRAVVVRGG